MALFVVVSPIVAPKSEDDFDPDDVVVQIIDSDRNFAREDAGLFTALPVGFVCLLGIVGSVQSHSWTILVISVLAAIPIGVFSWRLRYDNRLPAVARARCVREAQRAADDARTRRLAEARAEAQRLERLQHDEREYQRQLSAQQQSIRTMHASLRQHSEQIERLLIVARSEYSDKAFGPFWDAIEKGAVCLTQAQRELTTFARVAKDYCAFARPGDMTLIVRTDIPSFDVASNEFGRLVRLGQSNFEFAVIWEHRKTREAVIDGFGTLGDAVTAVGAAINSSLYDIRESIEYAQAEAMAKADAQEEHLSNIKGHMGEVVGVIRRSDRKR
jgi:hypothetical protein